jgi:hypothetical protein
MPDRKKKYCNAKKYKKQYLRKILVYLDKEKNMLIRNAKKKVTNKLTPWSRVLP